MSKKRIVLFGGTFDPVHLGHVATVSEAADHIGADEILFVPARCSPLKMFMPTADDADRLAMISLAIAVREKFCVSDYELKKSSTCYTLETVRHFRELYGVEAAIYWLAGADIIDELSHWYEAGQLIDECNLSVMFRGGCERPDFSRFEGLWGRERVEKLGRNVIETSLINISSTRIRKKLAAGEDVSGMLAPEVRRYIYEHGLYGAKKGD